MEHFDAMIGTMEDPITHEIMEEPVVTPYGHSFSVTSITRWLEMNRTCPITSKPLKVEDLKPNYALRNLIFMYKEAKQKAEQQRLVEKQMQSLTIGNSPAPPVQNYSLSKSNNSKINRPAPIMGNDRAISEMKEKLNTSQSRAEHLRSLKDDSEMKKARIDREKSEVTLGIMNIEQQIKEMDVILQKLLDAKREHVDKLLQLKQKEKETEDELNVLLNEIMNEEKQTSRLGTQLSQLLKQATTNSNSANSSSFFTKGQDNAESEEIDKEVSPRSVTPPPGRPGANSSNSTRGLHSSSSASLFSTSVANHSQASTSFTSSSAGPIPANSGDNLVYSFLGEFPRVWINTVHVDNRSMYAGCSDSSIKVYTMSGKNKKAKLEDDVNANQSYVMALLSDDRGHIWSGGADGSIKIWEFVQHKLRCISHYKNAHVGWVTQMTFLDKNDVMPSVSFEDDSAYVEQSSENVGVLKMNPNTILFTAANDGFVKVWNPRNFKCKHIYEHAKDKILCMSFCKTLFLTGSKNGIVTTWDANTQKLVGKATVHDASVSDMKIDDSRPPTLWTCSYDCKVKVWDIRVALNQPQITLSSHTAPVKSLVFDGATHKAFTGSKDGKIFLWDARIPNQPLLTVQHGQHGKKSSVLSLGISTEFSSLFSGGEDGRVVQWFCNLV